MTESDSITVEEAVQSGQTKMAIGTKDGSEDGGLRVEAVDEDEEWVWTDSPATNKR